MPTAIVTGGSRGIGAATCRLAASRGYDVCVNYSGSREAAERLVAEIQQSGRKAIAFGADVADPDALHAMFTEVTAALGRPDLVVCNAGIMYPMVPFDELTRERLRRIVDVNLLGTIYTAQEAARAMSKRHGGKGGSIVITSSIAAIRGGPNDNVDYAMTKGAIEAFMHGVAKQMATEGVRVNAVRPGLTHSDIHASVGDPSRVEKLVHTVPLKRGAEAEEIAEAILWLASDAAAYCVGTVLDVHGGRSI